MKKGLLITLPKWDDGTTYLSVYSNEIIKEAKSRKIKVKRVFDKELNKKDFSEIIKKLDYNFVVFNAHGFSDSIFGYKNQVLIKVGENENILRGRIIYARACNSANILGVVCIKKDKKGCFIGYTFPFKFYIEDKWSTKPLNDNLAKICLKPSNLVPLSLIKGNTTKEAHENSKKGILKTIKKLLLKMSEPDTPRLLEVLWNNYIGQVLIGNSNATI